MISMGDVISIQDRKEKSIREEVDKLLMDYYSMQIQFFKLWLKIIGGK